MAQRIAHAEEVGGAVTDWERLGAAVQQPHALRHARMLHHAGARIDPRDERCIADDAGRGGGQEPGPGADIDDPHARCEARLAQRAPPIPRAGAETDDALEAVVIAGAAIENTAHPRAALAFASIVGLKRRMG